jgi:hypothetical protein
MNRPVGVTILAILDFLGAAICILGGIGMLVGGGAIATAISRQAGASGAGIVAGLGAALGVVFLVCAAISALLGWGLWTLKNWARIITIVLLALDIGLSLLGLVGTLTHFNLFALIWSVFWIAVYALIIWYLLKPEVKAAFQGGQARAATA